MSRGLPGGICRGGLVMTIFTIHAQREADGVQTTFTYDNAGRVKMIPATADAITAFSGTP